MLMKRFTFAFSLSSLILLLAFLRLYCPGRGAEPVARVLAAVPVGAADASTNLVPNPSFEYGTTSPDGWTPCPDNTAWDTSVAHTGSHSARNPQCLWKSSTFYLPAGSYYFGFWHRETNTVNYAGAWLGPAGGPYWTFAASAYADGQWHYYEASVQINYNYSDVRVWLMGSSDSGGVTSGPAGTVWYDDIYLSTEPSPRVVTAEGILRHDVSIPECPDTWLEDCGGTSGASVRSSTINLYQYEGQYVRVTGLWQLCWGDMGFIDVTNLQVLPNPCIPPSVNIWVDRGEGGVYYVGDPIRVCYSVSRPIYVKIYDCPPGQSCRVALEGYDDGTGGCINGTITTPTGWETVRIEAIENGQVVAQDEAHFFVAQQVQVEPPPGYCRAQWVSATNDGDDSPGDFGLQSPQQITLFSEWRWRPSPDVVQFGPFNPGTTLVFYFHPGGQYFLSNSLAAKVTQNGTNSWTIGWEDEPINHFDPNEPYNDLVVDVQCGICQDAAEFVSQSSFPTVQPGQAFQIYFEVRNTGSCTWRQSDNYYLANINSTPLGANPRQELGADVAPGTTKRWDINMTAPTTPGTYRTQWMLKHGDNTFGPNMYIDVTVTPLRTADLAITGELQVESPYSPFAPNKVQLGVNVQNLSTMSLDGAYVRFFNGNPDAGGSQIGPDQLLGLLEASQSKPVWVTWELSGNIENRSVYARAYVPSGFSDPSPVNNTVSRTVSIYFVDFQHNRDAYSFRNDEVGVIPITDILGFLRDFDIPELLWGPLTPVFGILLEINGYCYGMSNSSLVYFFNPDLKPVTSKTTYEHTLLEARAKVRTYQWYGLGPYIRALIGLEPSEPSEQYRLTLESIRQGRPVIHGLMDRTSILPKGAHAVVAYKIIDLGSEKRVYYYDNNIPLNRFPANAGETYGVFNSSGFSEPVYSSKYQYNEAYVLQYQLSYPDNLRSLLLDLARWILGLQFSNAMLSFSSSGSADLMAVDPSGRRAGYLAGQEYNEIPGAVITKVSGGQSLLLPSTAQYQLQSVGTSTGNFSLDIVDPVSDSTARVIQFQGVTTTQGQTASAQFIHGLQDPRMTLPDGTDRPPDTNSLVDPNAPAFGAIQGSVAMQGRPAAPHQSWSSPISVEVRRVGETSIFARFRATSDSTGIFSVPSIPTGIYLDIVRLT
jgi:hypothetical protein